MIIFLSIIAAGGFINLLIIVVASIRQTVSLPPVTQAWIADRTHMAREGRQ